MMAIRASALLFPFLLALAGSGRAGAEPASAPQATSHSAAPTVGHRHCSKNAIATPFDLPVGTPRQGVDRVSAAAAW